MEDAASVRGVVKQILVEEGYVVDDVTSPLDVIELGPSDWAAYQLLVTDVVMPKMSGPELAAKVIAHNPDMRILFMSGYTEVSTAAPNVDAKAVAFVPKPFTAEALLGAVRKLLSP